MKCVNFEFLVKKVNSFTHSILTLLVVWLWLRGLDDGDDLDLAELVNVLYCCVQENYDFTKYKGLR